MLVDRLGSLRVKPKAPCARRYEFWGMTEPVHMPCRYGAVYVVPTLTSMAVASLPNHFSAGRALSPRSSMPGRKMDTRGKPCCNAACSACAHTAQQQCTQ